MRLNRNILMLAVVLSATGCAHNEDAVINAPAIVPTYTSEANQANSALQSKALASKIALETVYFGFDSYSLSKESKKIIKANIKALDSKPFIQIEGHCDERGSGEYNLALGEKRAKSARKYYVSLGYPAAKITTISYGKERPAIKGSGESVWKMNRRDEFKIVK